MKKNDNYTNSNVKILRELNGISQSKMSKDLNIDQSTLAKWENGSRQITLEWAIKISNYFNIGIGDFISENILYKKEKYDENLNSNYKRVLKDKGLMDENDNINEESFNKLMKIADMMKEMNDKEN